VQAKSQKDFALDALRDCQITASAPRELLDDHDPIGPFRSDAVCAAWDRLPGAIRDTVSGEVRSHRYRLADVVAALLRASYHPTPLVVLPGDVMAIIRHFGGPLSAIHDLDGEVHRLWWRSTQAMLHKQPPWPEPVGIVFRHRIDDAIRAEHHGTLPWQRNIERGAFDYFAMHARLLDRVDDIVPRLLPVGGRRHSGAVWKGRRTPEAPEITVCLLTGRWWAPERKGTDLVGLIAYVLAEKPGRVVKRMQTLLGVTAVRHV
jgi:hypothetical protein